MKILADKTVLLTGASGGIGVFIARALAREQATVVCVARSQAGLEQIRAEIEAVGGKGIAIPFDISQVEELPLLIEQINQLVGSIDVLINNAALEKYGAFSTYSLADFQAIFSINLLAAMELTRLLLPSMLGRDSGHIVNIASLAGKKGAPYNSIYSASKAGLIMWTDAIRQELAGSAANVSVICPGYVSQTGMTFETHVPIPIWAGTSTPESVADAVIKAIKLNKAEVIVNQDFITKTITKLLFAIGQVAPGFGDAFYRRIGVVKLNRMRAINQI